MSTSKSHFTASVLHRGEMKSLFVMDPLEKINITGDSTYVTMRECTDLGHLVWWCTPDDLFVRDGRCYARAEPVKTTREAPFFHREEPILLDTKDVDVVWMRKDPPFDMSYILTTYLLEMVPDHVLVVNDPVGLKRFNEKLWVQQRWPSYQPPTLLSRDVAQISAFVAEREKTVLKPWDGNGGRGVLITQPGDRNLSSMIELLTGDGKELIIAQGYIPEVVKGDRRILLFDGEVVGAMDRVPNDFDHRANMHAGAGVQRCELSKKDLEICQEIGPVLKETGQVFVGIDVIGGFLTEINVTSPTGIQELNRLYGLKLESKLVKAVKQRLELHRKAQ